MAFPFLGFLAGGAALSVLGGLSANSAASKQAAAQRQAERIAAAEKRDRAAKLAQRNIGTLRSGSADRNAFGRSSRAVVLNELAKNADAEESINNNEAIRIMAIDQRAANAKVDLISAAVSGAGAGLSFGLNLDFALGN